MSLKIVVVPCRKDADGNPLITRTYPPRTPYFYEILEVGAENSHRIVATVLHTVELKKVVEVAKLLASSMAVEVNANFYKDVFGYQ